MVEFWTTYLWPAIWIAILILVIVVPLLLAIAYLTYAERKVIAAMQLRQGPMVVGPMGLLQPIADGLKLLVKETVLPSGANKVVFLIAPMVTFTLALIGWAVIPFGDGLVLADSRHAEKLEPGPVAPAWVAPQPTARASPPARTSPAPRVSLFLGAGLALSLGSLLLAMLRTRPS